MAFQDLTQIMQMLGVGGSGQSVPMPQPTPPDLSVLGPGLESSMQPLQPQPPQEAQQGQGGMGDQLAAMLQKMGVDQQPQQISPREQRMQALRDFMSGTLTAIGQGLSAYSQAPAGVRNQAALGAALQTPELMRQQKEKERMAQETLSSQDRQRSAAEMLNLMRAQDINATQGARLDKIGAEQDLLGGRLENIQGALTNLQNARANQANATAANQTAQAKRATMMMTPRGLLDLNNPGQGPIPGTGDDTYIKITPEIAKTFGLPDGIIDQQLTALDINRLVDSIGQPYRIVSDAKSVRLINPVTGDEYVFGPPASTNFSGRPNQQMFMMYEYDAVNDVTAPIWVQPGTGRVIRGGNLGVDPSSLSAPAIVNPQILAASKEVSGGAKAAQFLKIVDDLSAQINQSAGMEAIVKGNAAKAAAAMNYNATVASYDTALNTFIPMWARAVGHTGVLTQLDVDSAKEAFPKLTDSKALRDSKMAIIKAIFGGNIQASKQLVDQFGGSATGRVLTRIFYDKDQPGDGQGILSRFADGRVYSSPSQVPGPGTASPAIPQGQGRGQGPAPVPSVPPGAPAEPAQGTRPPLRGRGGNVQRIR